MRRLLIAAALALATAAGAAAPPDVRFEKGRLSVTARRVPASDLCEAVRKRTGVVVSLDDVLAAAEVTADFSGFDIERGIRTLVSSIPGAAGHSVSYARGRDRKTRLVGVRVFGPGSSHTVTRAPTPVRIVSRPTPVEEPNPIATPSAEQRVQRMIDAGVPAATAERVMALTTEVQQLQATPVPGSLTAEDLAPDSRAQLSPLMERGVPMERAVQMLLIQERYRSALDELRSSHAPQILGEATPAPAR